MATITLGDLADSQSTEKPDLLSSGACRVPGLTGLANRRAPLDAGIFPKALLEWASACPSGDVRFAETAPAIYCIDVTETNQPHRLVAASRNPDANLDGRDQVAQTARYRLVPATYSISQPSRDDQPAAARAKLVSLTPRQVAVLGQVVAHVKYPLWGSHLLPCSTATAKFRITINAGAIIDRLGYARGGDAYRALEEDLSALAQFVVRHEQRERDGSWRAGAASTLLTYFNSGRCTIEHGQKTEFTGVRRDEQWVIELGSALVTLLRAKSADFAVIGAGLWAAAGRSRIDQWLALWVSGHGYDGRNIYEYRAETLGRRMRLLPETVCRVLAGAGRVLDKIEGIPPSNNPWVDTVQPTAKRPENDVSADEVPLSEALSIARSCWRQIRRSIARLESRNAIARGEWRHTRNAPDVRPSQAGRALSRVDLIRLHRWSGPVEGLLPRARRWLQRQWGDLLTAIDGCFTELGRLAVSDGPAAEWAGQVRQRYKERLEWLKAGNRPLAQAALVCVKQSLQRELAKIALMVPATRQRLIFAPAGPPGCLILSG